MEIFKQEIKTTEEKLDLVYSDIKTQSIRALQRFGQRQRQIFDMIWNGEEKPQDIFDKFGTDAKDLFIVSKAAEDYQKLALGESYTNLVVPYEFTINEDGTVQ